MNLQLSLSIDFGLCMPKKSSKVSRDKLPVIYQYYVTVIYRNLP